MISGEKKWTVIIGLICAAFIALRFWHLTDSCLWFDEIFSVHAAEHSFAELFWFVAQDLIHPPFFYVLLKLWISIGGENIQWLRTFPVLFSIATIVPFIFLCRQLKLNSPSIALALTFFSVSGSLVKYSQEVRMYSLLLCLTLFSLWIFARFLNIGKGIRILTLINILLVHTHYFGWFVVFSQVCLILYLQRIKIIQILIMFGITLISFAPWSIAVWRAAQINSNFGQNLGWAEKPGLIVLTQFLLNLIEPFYLQSSSIDAGSIYIVTVPLFFIFLTAVILYFLKRKTLDEKERNATVFLTGIVLIPVILSFVFSWILPFSIWGTRHLVIVFPAVSIILAKVLLQLNDQRLKYGLLAAIFLLMGIAFSVQSNRETQSFIWCGWEKLSAELPPNKEQKPVKIFVFEDLVAYHLWISVHETGKNYQIVKVNGIENLIEDKAYFLPRGFDEVQVTEGLRINEDDFFIAFRDKELDRIKPPLKNLIDEGFLIDEPKKFTAQGIKAFVIEVRRQK